MSPMQKRNTWLLVLLVPAVVGVSLLVQLAFPQEGWQFWLVRSFSLSGYLLVFLAVLSAASLPAMAKTFGRPFIGVHHVATVAGFVAMVAHPFAYSFAIGSLSPFVPSYGSLLEVFQWAGRPALALFAIAVLAALLRLAFKKGWRVFHIAAYLAFLLVTVHANLIGPSFQHPVMRVVSWVMAAAATVVFVRKRLMRRKAARPSAAPAAPTT
jgi:methionine sulfoxide reductase heme-binding subunit